MYRIVVSEVRSSWLRGDLTREIIDVTTRDPAVVQRYQEQYYGDHRYVVGVYDLTGLGY